MKGTELSLWFDEIELKLKATRSMKKLYDTYCEILDIILKLKNDKKVNYSQYERLLRCASIQRSKAHKRIWNTEN